MASSSSSVHNNSYVYDVFLSFCGEDTRKTFVDHLYVALDQQGICTFKDDERLQQGKKINDELLQSIEDSRCYIIVFSKNYASSAWCLNELLKIMECHKKNEQAAFPVFYDVDPSEVRKQAGAVGEGLAIHMNKNESEVENWREALKEAADLSGWDVRKTANGHEAKVIKLIVEQVSRELRTIDFDVDKDFVGMEQRMQDLDSCLEVGTDDVRMIGIKGMGGAGKTTLAWAIFNNISYNFEGKSFVENVREKATQNGLEKLQEKVLTDVLNRSINVGGVHEGKTLMRKHLCGKKVLVVLDDVDQKYQLEMLAGDITWFKPGSRIIITTREGQVLEAHRVKWIRDVNLLSDKEAICLFSRHAFGNDIPTQEYERYSRKVVIYAAGLPLTIKVLGSHLCGKDADEWNNALERLETIPLKETLKKLELSYINLEDDHKEIFLDVACFLRGWNKDDAIRTLESCGLFAKHGLKVLEQKSLIVTLKRYGFTKIDMHDHLVEMGKNIVRREHPNEPNKHSRLWDQEEIERVLVDSSGSKTTRCVCLEVTHDISLEGLRNMKKLRCFIANNYRCGHAKIDVANIHFPNSLQYLEWNRYLFWRLPKTFEANNLVTLKMLSSEIKQLWKGEKVMKKLKYLDLRYSKKLRRLDLELTPCLETLNLEECGELVKLNVHGGCLKSLVYLNITLCESLKSLFFIKKFESLKVLRISCLYTKKFPDYIFTGPYINSLLELHLFGYDHTEEELRYVTNLNLSDSDMKELPKLDLSDNDIEEVPSSIGNLHELVSLDINCCGFKGLSGSICRLQHLRTLNIFFLCIKELPEDLGQLKCLKYLHIGGSKVTHLPGSICMLKHLKTLILSDCKFLEYLPKDVGQLESLEILKLELCYELRELPNSICKLKCLKELYLANCKRLEKLPDELGDLKCLEVLDVRGTGITHLPQSISLLKWLKIHRDQVLDDNFIQLCSMYNPKNRQIQGFQHLKTLDLSSCVIEEVPEALGQLECLEELHLNFKNVKRLPNTICILKHLKKLFLASCTDLEKLPDDVGQSEESCGSIEELPEALGHLECLEQLHLSYIDVKNLPDSICMLKHLKKLVLESCVLLEKLPDDVGQLESLVELELSRCYSIREIPSSTCMLKQLKVLNLFHCFCLERLSEDVGQLESLEELYAIRCYYIREIPNSICMLKHLKKLKLESCRRLEKLPDELGVIESLQFLIIWDTGISRLPRSIYLLNGLQISGFILHTKAQSSLSNSLLRNKRKVIFDEELDIQAAGSSTKRLKCSWE